jgi:hypothetical protein
LNGSRSPALICQYFGPREVDTFRDPGEMREKAIQYLDRPELADEMGSRAAARCRSEHTYVHRARALLGMAMGAKYRAIEGSSSWARILLSEKIGCSLFGHRGVSSSHSSGGLGRPPFPEH